MLRLRWWWPRGPVGAVLWLVACSGSPTTQDGKDGKDAEKAATSKPAAKPVPAPVPTPTPPTRALPKTLTRSDAEAKAGEIWADHRQSFYCGCAFTNDRKTVRASCGYKTRANEARAHVIEWTQVVPPSAFGAHRACWTTEACRRDDGTAYGGIECCRSADPVFAAMESDLYNLVPVIGEVIEDRSDHALGEIKGEERLYGACDVEVDTAAGVIEPPERMRGDIARVYLYMRATYGDELHVAPEQWSLLESWNAADPADDWERTRSARIAAVQGQGDPQLAGAPAPAPAPGTPAAAPAEAGSKGAPKQGAPKQGKPKAPPKPAPTDAPAPSE
ncbi:MAG: endonuclease [Deltaproteobacteria bacterium]|nr:endonuclease [Deltaproteobacteria bacterium]MBK8237159.1 endonuclease [Deltaproteobacteria bacterium]MBP7291663.1 endonuclease [Nannocystaceae bacterium]